jgi:hypothetical protein
MITKSESLDEILTRLRSLLPELMSERHIATLAVFGSFVRGEALPDSDLDLLVTFTEAPSLFGFVAIENYLSDALGIKVDLVIKDSLKPHIGRAILEEAQPI